MVTITDKKIVQNRFGKSFETYNQQAIVQQKIAYKLANLLSNIDKQHFNRVLEIGCGTGFLTKLILSRNKINEYILNDIVESAFNEVQQTTQNLNFSNFKFIPYDAETADFPKNIDAIISSSTFQWFNNLESVISKMKDLLNSNGILAFSTFGEDNFKEIKSILNVSLSYKTLPELVSMVESNFHIIHAEEWKENLYFDCPGAVLKHMKLTGVNGLNTSYLGKDKLQLFNTSYRQQFSNEDKKVNLTYHPIIIIAQKRSTK